MRSKSNFILAGAMSVGLACLFAAAPVAAQNSPPRVDPNYPHPQPPYPDTAQLNGEQGTVVLRVKVGANGRVRNIEVETSSGFGDLDNAAIEGVLRWRFIPAMQDGDTATVWTNITIVFRLPSLPTAPRQSGP